MLSAFAAVKRFIRRRVLTPIHAVLVVICPPLENVDVERFGKQVLPSRTPLFAPPLQFYR